MQELADERLAELRTIAEAAEQVPWGATHDGDREPPRVWTDSDELVAKCCPSKPYSGHIPNAEHIATFDPPTVLALLDELTEARKRLGWVLEIHGEGETASWDNSGPYCLDCGDGYPCETVEAVRGIKPQWGDQPDAEAKLAQERSE